MCRNRRSAQAAPRTSRACGSRGPARSHAQPVDADPEAIRDLAYSIIRVLNRDGEAVGPWAGLLSDEALLAGLRDMMTLRAFDSRMLMAQRQGKTSFYMQHMGEEAVSCAFRKALLPGDMNFPTYRQAGLLIAAGHSLVDMMCQIYSNEQDPLKGRQLPVLYSRRRTGSSRSPATWRRSISRRSAGPWHPRSRAIRRSPRHGSATARPPNRTFTPRWSSPPPTRRRSCSTSSTTSGRSQPSRASLAAAPARSPRAASASASLPCGWTATTISPSIAVACWAAERARRNLGPTLIEHVTYRVGAHSTSDDPAAYRPKTESDAWPLGDPVIRLRNHLTLRGVWSEERHRQAEAEIMDTVMAAQREAESHGTLHAGGRPSVRDMFEGV